MTDPLRDPLTAVSLLLALANGLMLLACWRRSAWRPALEVCLADQRP